MAARTDYLGRDGYTWWVGEVEDIEDPSQIGRVRVRILGWYTGNSEGDAYLKEVPREIRGTESIDKIFIQIGRAHV